LSDKGDQFELRLPAGTVAKFQIAVAAIPTDKRVWWRYHKVHAGETLAAIARTYHTTPKAIAEANDLNDGFNNGAVQPQSRLIIPIAPGKQADTSTYTRATMRYKIRKGDTVESVAENFGVSSKMVRGWNHLKGSSLAGRKVLYLHLPVTRGAGEAQIARGHSSSKHAAAKHSASDHAAGNHSAPSDHPTGTQTAQANHSSVTVTHHTVKPGETLYSIANSYKTTVSALKHDNQNIAALRPGMILIIHNPR
jgi:LysM repeat protein